jgi:hypothetical protein
MQYRIGVLLAFLSVSISRPIAAEPEQGAPPRAQDFLKEGKPTEFIVAAKTFLDQQPPGKDGEPIAVDLLMVATLAKDENAIRNGTLRLVADYPRSITGQYLLSGMQSEAYAKFLKKCFDKIDLQAEPRTLATWSRAVETGFQHYGPRFADDGLVAQAALAAEDPAKGLALRKSIRYLKPESIRTLDIAFNPELTSRQKLLALKGQTGALAYAYRTILYDARLTAEEQADPELAGVVAEPMIKDGDFAKAEAVLARVSGLRDPRLLFWLAWAQGANGKTKESVDSLTALMKNHSSSPWAKPAAELLPAIQELEKSLQEHVSAADAALKAMEEKPPALVEIRLQSRPRAKTPFAGYLSLDVPADGAECLLDISGKTVAAVKISSDDNRLFVQGNSTIHQSAERYPIPYLMPEMKDKGNGNWSWDFLTAPAEFPIRENLARILKLPALANAAGRQEFLQGLVRKGRFPAPVQTAREQRVFRWLTPHRERPELQVTEVHLTKDHKIAAVTWGDIVSIQVKSGSHPELKFTPPRWPELPTEKHEQHLSELGDLGAKLWPLLEALQIFGDDEDEKVELAKKEPK